ncbi:MAG: type II toxin-antitoxin system RelE/ParE family toxin [Bdellovibrionales bacterium]
MPTRYTIKYEKQARSDVSKEYRWSKQNWGLKHARDFFAKIDGIIETLAENPHLYRVHHTDDGLEYHLVKIKGISIAYDINDTTKTVTILGFIGKNRIQDLNEILGSRLKN